MTVEPTTTAPRTTTTAKKTKKPKPTKYTTTKKPTTTEAYAEDATAGTDDENIYAPDSEVKGDPHFMVKSPGQDPICFDADAPSGVQGKYKASKQ